MHAFEIGLLALLAAVAVFQAWLTMRVWRSNLYDRKQKVMQTQLVWLLPIIGASLVLYVLHQDDDGGRAPQARVDK
jgi:putative copper export protein